MLKKIPYRTLTLSAALACMTMTAHAATGLCNNISAINQADCDFTFTTIPTFATICITQIESGQYTIRNNSPVTIKINYIRIQRNDNLPISNATVVAAPTNNCGTSLAAGASCNILVAIKPTVVGTINRVLQVGVDSRQIQLSAFSINFIACPTPPAPPPGPFFYSPVLSVPLDCELVGQSTITNTGSSAVNGSVCLSPGTSIVGFPPGQITNGTQEINTATANTAVTSYTTIKTFLSTQTCPPGTDMSGIDLGGLTLTPGTYCFTSGAALTGSLTLSGNGYYYFRIASTLTTASASSVVLIGGALSSQVFWDVGTAATLGTGTLFQGNILSSSATTLSTGASVTGRILAGTAITLDTNAVTQ